MTSLLCCTSKVVTDEIDRIHQMEILAWQGNRECQLQMSIYYAKGHTFKGTVLVPQDLAKSKELQNLYAQPTRPNDPSSDTMDRILAIIHSDDAL